MCASLSFVSPLPFVAVSDYKQSLQFRDLNEEKRNIRLENVIRGGKRVEISIYDIVVGDVIPLNIGDQVPADGILIVDHSLVVDESSMTGESNIVDKNSKNPFLISGCKVADGSGVMLVIWHVCAVISMEDDDEIVSETPVQASGSVDSGKKSNVWRFFKKIGKDRDGVEKASCNFCNREYSIGRNPKTNNSYGTSHLSRHVVACKAIPLSVRFDVDGPEGTPIKID
ncbi:Calcium-transporting ATPase 10, plasma membrane-type [Stylosanthes scabra]|uniref:Calcium-transporting ATPase 10, plasma membrane-type n=1 Tax=Stylosanthes scabra TaxID=79078 RepID=A0ABU6XPB0_9FABA|nr:Calcium-transporting ATPase 10, plasma membrane-type [Stylosanthes scabra]